jgi:NAD(P)H dehydrogenase (quinone)
MTKIAIVYFSGYGHTAKQAEAVQRGAASVAGAAVTMLRIDQEGNLPDGSMEVLAAQDAIIYGSPTYMGGPAWQFKKFADASSKLWMSQSLKDKLAAGFTNSAGMSGDKLLALQQLAGFAAQHGMIWVTLGQLPGWQTSAGSTDDENRLASFLRLMAQSNSDQGPDLVPPASDRATAKRFGRRIGEAAHRWTRGRVSAAASA